MKRPPKPLKGSGSMIQWLNELRDAVEARTPTDSPTVKVQENASSFRLDGAKQTGGGGNQNTVCVWG